MQGHARLEELHRGAPYWPEHGAFGDELDQLARVVRELRRHALDIVMPRKSGLEALREIAAAHPGACVVMCSALGQEALVMEALEAGARDFIVKPFKPDHVLEVAQKALAKSDD